MFKTLANAFADKQIRKKMFMTLITLLICRLGCYIPLPGIDVAQVTAQIASNDFMSVMSTITGGALSNATLFSLGIIPFINAFIIMQLLTLIFPALEELSRQGEEGAKKRNKYTRYMALLLALIQAIGVVVSWKAAILPTFSKVWVTQILIVVYLIAGSSVVMWLGERITEYGIGNGTSLIIFVGILASAGTALGGAFKTLGDQPTNAWYILLFLLVVLVVFVFIVFVDMSERKITVQYSKQVKGNKVYGGQSTHIPIKVNSSGVMPIIFASSFLMFPVMIFSFWSNSEAYVWVAKNLGSNSVFYIIALPVLILFFTFFYSMIQFNPEEVAKNIQRYGGFIPGIRPGKPTGEYLAKINRRITLFGAIYLAFLALVPAIVFKSIGQTTGLTNAFTATGMLIVVSVALELDKQLQSQLMMKHSKGFLK